MDEVDSWDRDGIRTSARTVLGKRRRSTLRTSDGASSWSNALDQAERERGRFQWIRSARRIRIMRDDRGASLITSTALQDLKDFARAAGTVTFADVDRNNPSLGCVPLRSSHRVRC
mgnify:FL=1